MPVKNYPDELLTQVDSDHLLVHTRRSSSVSFSRLYRSKKYIEPQRRAHPATADMPTKSLIGAAKRARRRARVAPATDTQQSDAQEAIPRLPNHVVVAHVLRSELFDDPEDLARLPAVSRAMRDAVAATGLRFEELHEDKARELGCLSALQRWQRRGLLSRQEYLCEAAARGGNLEALKLLRDKDTPWDAETCAGAAQSGHLEVLQWVRANGCPWKERTCTYAALGGHLEVLQWARANGCPCNKETCSNAAFGGHLEVLQWARANGCPWDEETCVGAAEGGQLEVLSSARANGCPWNEWTCEMAVKGGHLELLQWARANGCPWNRNTRKYASGSVMEWVVASGVPE